MSLGMLKRGLDKELYMEERDKKLILFGRGNIVVKELNAKRSGNKIERIME